MLVMHFCGMHLSLTMTNGRIRNCQCYLDWVTLTFLSMSHYEFMCNTLRASSWYCCANQTMKGNLHASLCFHFITLFLSIGGIRMAFGKIII